MEAARGELVRGPWRWARGLWTLLRFVPVLTWSGAALLIGIGIAYAQGTFNPLYTLLMLGGAVLLQGFVTHAYNDITDWRSGTDPASPRIMSGGSHVIPQGYFTPRGLGTIGAATLLLTLAIGLYFIFAVGPGVAIVLAVGVYAGVFYTTPPLATGYRPFVGEWLTALPALVALPVGAYYILTRTLTAAVLVAGSVHGILCIARLMNHHIPDMAADAAARPRKVTSVVWVRDHLGLRYVPWLGALYFLVAAAVAGLGGLLINPSLAVPLPFALASAGLAATADPSDAAQVTRRELWISLLIVASAVALVMAFNVGG